MKKRFFGLGVLAFALVFGTANVFAQDLTNSTDLAGKAIEMGDSSGSSYVWVSNVQGKYGYIWVGYVDVPTVIPGQTSRVYMMGALRDWKDGGFAFVFPLVNTTGSTGDWVSSSKAEILLSFRDGKWDSNITQLGTSPAALPDGRGDTEQEQTAYWTAHINHGRSAGL